MMFCACITPMNCLLAGVLYVLPEEKGNSYSPLNEDSAAKRNPYHSEVSYSILL